MAYALLGVFVFPTVAAAAVVGFRVAQDHLDPWLFVVVLVAGSVCGLGAAALCTAVLYGLQRLIERLTGRSCGCGCGLDLAYLAAAVWVGPAVATVVAVVLDVWW